MALPVLLLLALTTSSAVAQSPAPIPAEPTSPPANTDYGPDVLVTARAGQSVWRRCRYVNGVQQCQCHEPGSGAPVPCPPPSPSPSPSPAPRPSPSPALASPSPAPLPSPSPVPSAAAPPVVSCSSPIRATPATSSVLAPSAAGRRRLLAPLSSNAFEAAWSVVGSLCPPAGASSAGYPDLADPSFGQLGPSNWVCEQPPSSPVRGMSAQAYGAGLTDWETAGWSSFYVEALANPEDMTEARLQGLELMVIGNVGAGHAAGAECSMQAVDLAVHEADPLTGEPAAAPRYSATVSLPQAADRTFVWRSNESAVLALDLAPDSASIALPTGRLYWLRIKLIADYSGSTGLGQCHAFWAIKDAVKNPPLAARWAEAGAHKTSCLGAAAGATPSAAQSAFSCANSGVPGGVSTTFCQQHNSASCGGCPVEARDHVFALFGFVGLPGGA